MTCVTLFAAICFRGLASWYGPGLEGHPAANGEPFHQAEMTAASRTIPLGRVVDVTNLSNGRVVRVRITDRGPFVDDARRLLDLSREAARRLGFEAKGIAEIEYTVVG